MTRKNQDEDGGALNDAEPMQPRTQDNLDSVDSKFSPLNVMRLVVLIFHRLVQ